MYKQKEGGAPPRKETRAVLTVQPRRAVTGSILPQASPLCKAAERIIYNEEQQKELVEAAL